MFTCVLNCTCISCVKRDKTFEVIISGLRPSLYGQLLNLPLLQECQVHLLLL